MIFQRYDIERFRQELSAHDFTMWRHFFAVWGWPDERIDWGFGQLCSVLTSSDKKQTRPDQFIPWLREAGRSLTFESQETQEEELFEPTEETVAFVHALANRAA